MGWIGRRSASRRAPRPPVAAAWEGQWHLSHRVKTAGAEVYPRAPRAVRFEQSSPTQSTSATWLAPSGWRRRCGPGASGVAGCTVCGSPTHALFSDRLLRYRAPPTRGRSVN